MNYPINKSFISTKSTLSDTLFLQKAIQTTLFERNKANENSPKG